MKTEDDYYKQDIDIHQRELWGDGSVTATKKKSDDEMEVMAARDVIVNHTQPSQYVPSPQPNGISASQAALMAGALALGAGGLGYGLASKPQQVEPASPVIQQIDADEYDLGLLPP